MNKELHLFKPIKNTTHGSLNELVKKYNTDFSGLDIAFRLDLIDRFDYHIHITHITTITKVNILYFVADIFNIMTNLDYLTYLEGFQ